ncbi:helix-turn-helix domain-containing protein [Comamonas odontotermitis]|uniref:helix-turn-helix domain-containing protein n=1 Tax=Comamonas odontotermitis TaxID=379895 RepID=UPI00367190F2
MAIAWRIQIPEVLNSLMAQTGGWGEIKPCAKLWLVRGMGFCRGDYQDRKRRQAQGIEKAKAAGKFRGKQPNHERNSLIAEMIGKGISWSSVCAATGCSRSTIKRIMDEKKNK